MARTKQPAHAGAADRGSSSPSIEESGAVASSELSTSSAVEDMVNSATSTTDSATVRSSFTASERRRQTTLFLADAEQFAFDFGGEATRIAATVVEDAAEQRAARRAEELADTTARVVAAAAAAGHATTTAATHPLTVEEVSAYAADALVRGPRRFLTLPRAGAQRSRGQTSAGEAAEEGATLAEALPQFKAALRRYDEGLWRDNKQHREEEEKRRAQARKRQRA